MDVLSWRIVEVRALNTNSKLESLQINFLHCGWKLMNIFSTRSCRDLKLREYFIHFSFHPNEFQYSFTNMSLYQQSSQSELFLSHFYVPSDVLHSNKQNKSEKDGKVDRSQREGAQKCHNLELSSVFLFPTFSFTSAGDC